MAQDAQPNKPLSGVGTRYVIAYSAAQARAFHLEKFPNDQIQSIDVSTDTTVFDATEW